MGHEKGHDPRQEEKVKIKPCPFCNSSLCFLQQTKDEAYCFWVSCDVCECDGPIGKEEDEAIKAWNRARRPR